MGNFFGFPSKKTSAVESSSHAPSRASGRPSRGAAHFFVARGVGWMEEKMAHLSKMRLGSRYVGGPVGLAEIYCQNGGDRNSGRFLGQKIDPLASRHRKVAQTKRPEYFELPRSRPGQDSTLLTALSSQPKTLRWAESGVRLTERGELLGADAGSHSNRFQFQRRC